MTGSEERISNNQFAFMIMLFEIGSTPLFLIGGKAKQDAWLAMSFAAVFGLLLILLFISLQQKEPGSNLIGMLKTGFGRMLGSLLGSAYVLYFLYESMRNVRDFGELITLTLLSRTPMTIIMAIVVLIASYGVYKGVEVIFRMSEVLMPVVLFSYLFLILLLIVSKVVHFRMLTPVLEDGFAPVLKAAFPEIVSFPFGQMVIFLMFWNLRSDKRIPVKASFAAYITVALFLVSMNALNIAILGPALAGKSALPFLQSVQLISIAPIFERLDVFVTLLIYIGLFIKMIAFYVCAVLGCSQLTGTAYLRWVLPAGLIIFGSSFLEPNYSYHISLGFTYSLNVFTVFQIAIPAVLFIALVLRRDRAGAIPDR
jgi:spore germination protein KB